MIPLKISFKNYGNRFPDILPTFFRIPKQIRPFIIEPEASLLGLFILKNTGKMSQKNLFEFVFEFRVVDTSVIRNRDQMESSFS